MPPDRRERERHDPAASTSANSGGSGIFKRRVSMSEDAETNANEAGAGPSGSGGTTNRRRISKACENCRVRRTKCSGSIPCSACTDNALEGSCYVREKARPNRLAYSARRSRPTVEDAELLIRPIEDRASISSRNSPSRPLSRSPRYNPIADIELRAQRWCVENGLTPNSLLFHDEDRMSLLPSTPLPTLHSSLIAFEDNLMRHLILSRDADNQGKGGIGRSQFVRLYNRYRADPSSLADDQKAVVFAVLCLAKHDTLHQYYSTGRWSEVRVQVEGGQMGRDDGDGETDGEEQGPLRGHGVIGNGDGDRSANGKARGPVGREDVTYFRMACGCLAGVRNPSVYAVLSLLCLVPFAQAHGGMGESRSLLRMMAWHVREVGLHRQSMVDRLEPGDVDPAVFGMFRYMDTFMAGLDDLQPFFANSESDVPLDIPPHVTPTCQQTASMFSRVLYDDLADPTLDIRSDGYVNVAESSWAPALEDVRREKGRGRVARVRLIWTELRYHWLRILLYTCRSIPPSDPSRSAQAVILVTHSVTQLIYLHYELVTNSFLYPSWPQIRRLAIMSQLLVLCTAQGEIPSAQAEELFGKVLKVLDNHKSGWARAVGRLEEGLRRAGVALGLAVDASFPPMLPEPSGTTFDSTTTSIPTSSGPATVLDPSLGFVPPANDDPTAGTQMPFRHQAQAQLQPPEELWGMFPFDPMSLFLDDSLWTQGQGSNGQTQGIGQEGQGDAGQGGPEGMEVGFDEAALNELLGIPMSGRTG